MIMQGLYYKQIKKTEAQQTRYIGRIIIISLPVGVEMFAHHQGHTTFPSFEQEQRFYSLFLV